MGCYAIINNSKYITNLEKLNLLSRNNIGEIIDCGITSESSHVINENISYLKNLKEIYMSGNYIIDEKKIMKQEIVFVKPYVTIQNH